jgi:hypothetical protein
MYREINRFPELQSDMEEAFNIRGIHRASMKPMQDTGQSFRSALLRILPEGEGGPPGQERPSVRIWGTRLKDALGDTYTSVDARANSIGFAVALDHPSVDDARDGDVLSWFQFGTRPHRVPDRENRVVFWWGSPLKWPQYGGPPGVRSSTQARQWGVSTERRGYWARPYGNFVGMAMDETESAEESAVDTIYRSSITRPLGRSTYLRRII